MSALKDGGPTEISQGLSVPLSDLLLLSSRRQFAAGEYERAQLLIANTLQNLAADTAADWYAAAGADQVAAMRAAVAEAAAASAELAQRFFDAGNISSLALKLEQAAAHVVQDVLEAARMRSCDLGQKADLGQMLQPAADNRPDKAGLCDKVFEPMRAKEGALHDQQHWNVANDFQRAPNRAGSYSRFFFPLCFAHVSTTQSSRAMMECPFTIMRPPLATHDRLISGMHEPVHPLIAARRHKDASAAPASR